MLEKYRYLYVEDDPLSREVMSLLMDVVIEIDTYDIFADSHNFMERVLALPHPPDVIMLDIRIKPINGFEMLAALRAHPDFKVTPVIALTASVMNEQIKNLREAGFDGAISKPLDIVTMPDLLTHILNGETIWHVG